MEEKHKNKDFSKVNTTISKLQKNLLKELLEKTNLQIVQEYCIRLNEGKIFYYDFVYENKIIEFNGDYWHANPEIYKEDFINRNNRKVAKDIWEYDKWKINTAIEKGFKVLIVWESEYINNPLEIVEKCIKFLMY